MNKYLLTEEQIETLHKYLEMLVSNDEEIKQLAISLFELDFNDCHLPYYNLFKHRIEFSSLSVCINYGYAGKGNGVPWWRYHEVISNLINIGCYYKEFVP